MVTKKQFLLNQLTNEHWVLVLALAAVKLFRTREAIALLPGSSVEWGGRRLDLHEVAATLANPAEATLVLNQFLKVHMRAFIRDSFENIKAYCKETNQEPELRGTPWYHFARLIRNCIAHDFRFSFKPSDLTLLPLVWHNLEIRADMGGTELTLERFSIDGAFTLFDEMRVFVQTSLV